jgi:hypothetical protein
MELIDRLTSELKVNARQAEGGIGALMYVVKDQCAAETFTAIQQVIPSVDDWMRASPEQGGTGVIGLLDGIFGQVPGGRLDAFARLGGHFQSLGMSPTIVKPFCEQTLAWLQARIEDGPRNQIEKLHEMFMQ